MLLVASPVALSIFQPVLERFVVEAGTWLGTSDVHVVPIRYDERPYSHILRIGIRRAGSRVPDRYAFVKVFKRKPDLSDAMMQQRVSHDFEVTTKVHNAMQVCGDLGAVTPLACYPDLLAIITQDAGGDTLQAYLDSQVRWFPNVTRLSDAMRTMAKIGHWVRAFQQIEPGAAIVPVAALRDYVDIRLQRLVMHSGGGVGAATARRILEHIDDLGTGLSSDALREVPIHADFAPGNILVDGTRIVVLDLAMMRRGVRVHDLARLWMQLDLLTAKPMFRATTIRTLQKELLRAFESDLTADDPLFRLASILHRVNHLSTLLLRRERFGARIYNTRLIRMHRRWLDQELASTAARP
jgi:hypothetical protein